MHPLALNLALLLLAQQMHHPTESLTGLTTTAAVVVETYLPKYPDATAADLTALLAYGLFALPPADRLRIGSVQRMCSESLHTNDEFKELIEL